MGYGDAALHGCFNMIRAQPSQFFTNKSIYFFPSQAFSILCIIILFILISSSFSLQLSNHCTVLLSVWMSQILRFRNLSPIIAALIELLSIYLSKKSGGLDFLWLNFSKVVTYKFSFNSECLKLYLLPYNLKGNPVSTLFLKGFFG